MPVVRAIAPCSTSNIGPGFDTLGLALSRYVEVTVDEHDGPLLVETFGDGADLPADRSHLAAQIAMEVLGHDRLHITVRSDIPVGRGLGSSASLAVAAAAAAGSPDPLGWGQRIDHHPENAAASCLGGLVAATVIDGEPMAVRLALDPGLTFVAVIPDRHLPTAAARAALPATVPLADAGFNLSRLGVLIAALADLRLMTPRLLDDRLHQDARAATLYPEAPPMLAGLVAAGALGSCWSGAGPTLLAICDGADVAEQVRAMGERLLAAHALPGRSLTLAPDHLGLRIE